MGTFCRVKSCCCGCSLRTGSLIIAIVDLISALTVLIYAIMLVTDDGNTDYWDMKDRPITGFQIEDGRFIGSNQLFFSEDRRIFGSKQSFPEFFLEGLLYVLALMSSIMILTDTVLFIGILGGRFKMVSAWVGYAYLTSFFTLVGIIGITVAYLNGDDPRTGFWQIIVFALFYFGFKVYFMMVVGSYANTLLSGANYFNGVNMTIFPSTRPQAYPNGRQPLYPNVNEQNTVDPNGRLPNPSEQQQTYPTEQPLCSSGQQQVYPNGPPPPYPRGQQQIHPSVQQTHPNSQSEQPPPYSIEQPQIPLPPMSEIKRDL